jgi:hypothetical protein
VEVDSYSIDNQNWRFHWKDGHCRSYDYVSEAYLISGIITGKVGKRESRKLNTAQYSLYKKE